MKLKTTTLLLLAVGTLGSNAETLLENSGYFLNATQVRYTFETDGGNNIAVPLQTDDSGNNRTITGINNGGCFLNAPLAPGSTNSVTVTNNSFGYGMANTAGMATDNYQITIYVAPLINYYGYHAPAVIFDSTDGVRLGINNAVEFYAEVDGVTLGTQLTGDGDSNGLMIQKKNGVYSFWIADVNTTNWVQVGVTHTPAATVGDDFSGTHMFVKQGGGEIFWGSLDDFKIQSFTTNPPPTPGDFTWNNGASTAIWNTADLNWTGSAWNNVVVNNAIFGATGAGPITVGTPIIVGNMTFSAPGYTISGSSLSFVSTTITNSDPVTISSTITGSTGLTKAGAGALTLSGPVAYSGATTVSAGSLTFGTGTTLGALSLASATTVTAAANDASITVNGNLTLDNGATLAATGTPDATYGNVWLPPNNQNVIATGNTTSTISAQLNMRELHAFDVADGTAATDLLISGKLENIPGIAWGGLIKSGDGTLELSSPSNGHGGNYIYGGTLVFVNGSLGNVGGPYAYVDFRANSTLRWAAGNTQDISSGGKLIITDGVTATLDTNGNDVTLATAISAASGSLEKTGAGILTLAAANAYTGDTTVSGGTLSLANANLSDTSTVTVANSAILNLTHGVTDIVGTLVLGPNTFTSGTFSAATHSPFISGSGTIQVGADPFASWINEPNWPGLADRTAGGDPDNDGIKNLIEYILQGGDPSVSTTGTLPTLDATGENFVFTYYRRADATGTTQTFEYGDNLSGWTPVAIPDGPGVIVTDQGGGIDKVEITVAKGANTKLFGRLKATQP